MTKEDSLYSNRNSDVWHCIRCVEAPFPLNNINDDNEFLCTIRNKPDSLLFDCVVLNRRIDNIIKLGCIDDSSPLRDNNPDNFVDHLNETNLSKNVHTITKLISVKNVAKLGIYPNI